ncbi:zinc finger protein 853 isoform X8 [Prorops nasuta]|uniref:zinc finger protein 853 isoform X8 n=1 Tax=Prorops nasuta TaxID=863751 RepID=UPI0034CF088E
MEVQVSAATVAANFHALRQHVIKMGGEYCWQQPPRVPPQHSPGIQHSPVSNSVQQQQQQAQQMHSPLAQHQQQQQAQQQNNTSVQQNANTGLGHAASPQPQLQQQQQQQQQHGMSMSQQNSQGAQHQSSPAPTTPSPQTDHQGSMASSMAQSLHSLGQATNMSQASSPSLAALNQNLGQVLTQALTQNMQQNLGQTLQHNLSQSLTPSLSPKQQQQLLNQPQNLSQASQSLQQNIQSQAQNFSQGLSQQQAQNLTQNLGQSLSQQSLQQQAQNLTQNLQQQAQNLSQNLQQQALNMTGSIGQNGALTGMNMSANQQQNSQNSMLSPGAGSQDSHDATFTEKLMNELQSRGAAASLGAVANAGGQMVSLEECWNTLQRVISQIFMQKSPMQMHPRDLGAGLTLRQGGMVPGALASLGVGVGVGPTGMIGANEVKPHQCQQCLKSFSSNHQLVQHIRVHTGEKPYKCSYCDRKFKQLSHVQQHTRLHTGKSNARFSPSQGKTHVSARPCERPYKCHLPDCGRAFIQLSNLQQHLRNHDAQVERAKNRPFHCTICGKGFATESSLRTHTSKVSHELQQRVVFQQHNAMIGSPANATSCPVCHKLFIGGEALMEHMKHTHKDPNASGVASLLTHMEHMRMDPKHQFAAQYVLSRAAAERREREILASSSLGLGVLGNQTGGPQNLQQPPMCPSPSAHSDSSSGNGRLSSADSETDFFAGAGLLNNNNNNNNNNMASPGPSSNKLSEMLRQSAGNQSSSAQQYHDDIQSQQQRMAVMAAAVSAGLQNSSNLSPVDVALAAAMRMSNNNDMGGGTQGSTGHQQQGVQATGPESQQALRIQQAEAFLRSQAETALRLAVSQAAVAAASSVGGDVRHHLGQHNGGEASGMTGHHTNQQMSQQDALSQDHGGGGFLGEALRLQDQRLEQALRLHDPRTLSFTLQHVVNQQNNNLQP